MSTRETARTDASLPRLATYGTLAPGRVNHHQLDGLEGRWSTGVVHGVLVEEGWGASLGYPALVLDPDGAEVEVHVLASVDLAAHWARLDAFEGSAYERVAVRVDTVDGPVEAFLYASAQPLP